MKTNLQYKKHNIVSWGQEWWRQEEKGRDYRQISESNEFVVLVMVSWVNIYVKTHWDVHFKYVCFIYISIMLQ